MSSYVMLFKFTPQGIGKIQESPARIDAAKKLTREFGGEVKQFFGLMGPYDTMFLLDAPNDETAFKIAAAIGAQGNVQTETWRALAESEYRKLVTELPGRR